MAFWYNILLKKRKKEKSDRKEKVETPSFNTYFNKISGAEKHSAFHLDIAMHDINRKAWKRT